MTFTREDFQREYNLGEEDVRETLKACGLSLKKRNYSARERESFARARKLFDEGTANSYDDIANYFNGTFRLKNQQKPYPEELPSILKAPVTGYNLSEAYLKRVLRRSAPQCLRQRTYVLTIPRSHLLNKSLHGHSIQLVHMFKTLQSKALSSVLIHLYAESSD